MKTDIIIQARIGSTRLPWKVMLSLAWKPALWHDIERCKKCENVEDIIIATTTNSEDNIIERLCIKNNVKYYRWSSNNVLKRYYETAKKYKSDNIVRVTSDCPLIEPEIIDELIKNFDYKNFDYKSNCLDRVFPRWLDCEIFTFASLENANNLALENFEKEHVTPYIMKNWKTDNFLVNKKFYSDARLTLDTLKDYELINYLYDNFYENWKIIGVEDIIKYLNKNEKVKNINVSVKQKEIT